MAVGVGVGTVAGVIIGLMLARGVGLLPGLTGCLLAVATTGVGLMLAVGGSEVLALNGHKDQDVIMTRQKELTGSGVILETISGLNACVVPAPVCGGGCLQTDLPLLCTPLLLLSLKVRETKS